MAVESALSAHFKQADGPSVPGVDCLVRIERDGRTHHARVRALLSARRLEGHDAGAAGGEAVVKALVSRGRRLPELHLTRWSSRTWWTARAGPARRRRARRWRSGPNTTAARVNCWPNTKAARSIAATASSCSSTPRPTPPASRSPTTRALGELGLVARVGIHVGPVALRDNTEADIARGAKRTEVEGLAKPFAARVMALARGGQTLLSAEARAALGTCRPKGPRSTATATIVSRASKQPVEVFELGLPGCTFVAAGRCRQGLPRGAQRRSLAAAARSPPQPGRRTRCLRRSRVPSCASLARRLDAGARLVTVLGSGGTGKTRLVRRYAWPGSATGRAGSASAT